MLLWYKIKFTERTEQVLDNKKRLINTSLEVNRAIFFFKGKRRKKRDRLLKREIAAAIEEVLPLISSRRACSKVDACERELEEYNTIQLEEYVFTHSW